MPNPQNKSILEKIFLDTNIEKSQSAPPITQSTIYITPGTAENDWVTVAGTTTELATLISTGPATTNSIANSFVFSYPKSVLNGKEYAHTNNLNPKNNDNRPHEINSGKLGDNFHFNSGMLHSNKDKLKSRADTFPLRVSLCYKEWHKAALLL